METSIETIIGVTWGNPILSGWWFSHLPLWKIWVKVSWDDEILNIWKKTCSKPPTSHSYSTTRGLITIKWPLISLFISPLKNVPNHQPVMNQVWYIWVIYNISLTWIKAIWGWFPLLTMISSEGEQWGRYNLPRYIHWKPLNFTKPRLWGRTCASSSKFFKTSRAACWTSEDLQLCRDFP